MNSEEKQLAEISKKLDVIIELLKGNNFFEKPINKYGETIGEAIQGQLIRGLRGIEL